MDLVTALALELSPQAPDVVSFVGAGGKTSALFRLANEITASNRRVVATTTTRLSSHEITATQSVVEVGSGQLPVDDIARALDVHGQCMLVGTPGVPAEVGDPGVPKRTGLKPEQVDDLVRYAGQLGLSAILVEADGSRMLPVKAPAQYEPVLPSSTSVLVPIAGMDAVGRLIQEHAVHRPQNIRQLLGISSQDESIRLSPNMLAKIVGSERGGAKHLPPGARLVPLFNKAERATRYAFARLACRQLTRMNRASLIGAVGARHVSPVRERWGPLAAVVLAAGESLRMGGPKQLIAVDGEPMVLRAARIALESGVSQVYVVTGAYAGQVRETLAPLLDSAAGMLQTVHNAQWASGQASSVCTGLNALSPQVRGALFLPADQPFLQPAYLRQMLKIWRGGAQIVAPQADGTVRGSPALFDRQLWRELLLVRGDVGGRVLLERHPDLIETLPMSSAFLRDIDEPSDLGC